jgi:hypothetical protein
MVVFLVPTVTQYFYKASWFRYFFEITSPYSSLYSNVESILATQSSDRYPSLVYTRFLFLALQTIFTMALSIYCDWKKCHGFKGKDGHIQKVDRIQLDERPDVL